MLSKNQLWRDGSKEAWSNAFKRIGEKFFADKDADNSIQRAVTLISLVAGSNLKREVTKNNPNIVVDGGVFDSEHCPFIAPPYNKRDSNDARWIQGDYASWDRETASELEHWFQMIEFTPDDRPDNVKNHAWALNTAYEEYRGVIRELSTSGKFNLLFHNSMVAFLVRSVTPYYDAKQLYYQGSSIKMQKEQSEYYKEKRDRIKPKAGEKFSVPCSPSAPHANKGAKYPMVVSRESRPNILGAVTVFVKYIAGNQSGKGEMFTSLTKKTMPDLPQKIFNGFGKLKQEVKLPMALEQVLNSTSIIGGNTLVHAAIPPCLWKFMTPEIVQMMMDQNYAGAFNALTLTAHTLDNAPRWRLQGKDIECWDLLMEMCYMGVQYYPVDIIKAALGVGLMRKDMPLENKVIKSQIVSYEIRQSQIKACNYYEEQSSTPDDLTDVVVGQKCFLSQANRTASTTRENLERLIQRNMSQMKTSLAGNQGAYAAARQKASENPAFKLMGCDGKIINIRSNMQAGFLTQYGISKRKRERKLDASDNFASIDAPYNRISYMGVMRKGTIHIDTVKKNLEQYFKTHKHVKAQEEHDTNFVTNDDFEKCLLDACVRLKISEDEVGSVLERKDMDDQPSSVIINDKDAIMSDPSNKKGAAGSSTEEPVPKRRALQKS